MKILPKDRQIYISGRLWHEIHPKVRIAPFIYALHERIDLKDYGEGLDKFYFTFIIQNRDFFKSAKFYSTKKREADISVEIPIEKVETATNEETIKLMEEAYLEGIEKLKTIKQLRNFDVDAFKRDVEKIFSQEKWYEMAEAA